MDILFLLTFAVVFTPVQGVKTSCGMKPVGESGVFYCRFGEDIKQMQAGFVIQRYNLTSNSKIPDAEVLQCTWLSRGLDCPVKQAGYEFDMEVTDILFVKIPKLTADYNGKYVCQVIGNDFSDDEKCTYTYSDSFITAANVIEKSTPLPTRTTTEAKRPVDETHFNDNSMGWGIGLTVALAVLSISVTIALCFLWKKGKTANSTSSTDIEHQGTSTQETSDQTVALMRHDGTSVEQQTDVTVKLMEFERRLQTVADKAAMGAYLGNNMPKLTELFREMDARLAQDEKRLTFTTLAEYMYEFLKSLVWKENKSGSRVSLRSVGCRSSEIIEARRSSTGPPSTA